MFSRRNVWLLRAFCGSTDVDRIYRTHFMQRKADIRYSDMTDLELMYRSLGIILESIAFAGGQVGRGKNKNQTFDSVAVEEE